MRNCNFVVEPEANDKLSYSSFSLIAVHEVGPPKTDSLGPPRKLLGLLGGPRIPYSSRKCDDLLFSLTLKPIGSFSFVQLPKTGRQETPRARRPLGMVLKAFL